MKIWKEWSYPIILILCGAVVLGTTDSWKALGEPAARAKSILLAFGTGRDQMIPDGGEETSGPEESDSSENTSQNPEEQPLGPQDPDIQDPDLQVPDVEHTGTQEPEETWRDPSEVVYAAAGDEYFSDAVFIGDSRTVGMYEYGDLENISTFYASTGLTVYSLFDSAIVEVPGQKARITVEQALSERQFAKIYLMVGINEMGRGDLEGFLAEYAAAVERLKELQPNAIIYLQGILKVSAWRNSKGDHIHNAGIEERNVGIAALADNVRVYYLDVNPVLCDENGCLESSYTSDGVHLKAKYIPLWKDFLKQHTVVLD